MACPYFIPERRCESELWQHRARLPLGDGFEGRCSAPGFEAAAPSEEQLKSACNLGNAHCARLPEDRATDSVRFHVAQDQGGELLVSYCTERAHKPGEHGVLRFDTAAGKFVSTTGNIALMPLAQAFVQSHFQKHPRSSTARS